MRSFLIAAVRLVYDGRWKTEPTTAEHFAKVRAQINLQEFITPSYLQHLHQLVDNETTPPSIRREAERTILFAMRSASPEQKKLFDVNRILEIVNRQPANVRDYENAWVANMPRLLTDVMGKLLPVISNKDAVSQDFFDRVKMSMLAELAKPSPNHNTIEGQFRYLDMMLGVNPQLGKVVGNIEFLMEQDLNVLTGETKSIQSPAFFGGKRHYLSALSDDTAQRLFATTQGIYIVSEKGHKEASALMLSALLEQHASLRTNENLEWVMNKIDLPEANRPVENGQRSSWHYHADYLMSGLIQVMRTDPVVRKNQKFMGWMKTQIDEMVKGTRYADSWRQSIFPELKVLTEKSIAVHSNRHDLK